MSMTDQQALNASPWSGSEGLIKRLYARLLRRPRRPRCVIVVQNLSVPLDRRVYQQAKALSQAGWVVHVICPRSAVDAAGFERREGISIHRHWVPAHKGGLWGLLLEYAVSLMFESILLSKIFVRTGFDVIQVCNPPDILVLVALPYKLAGAKLVYDQHDDVPALFRTKFGDRWLLAGVRIAERSTIFFADFVLCASGSYRRNIVERGSKNSDKVVTVLGVPDLRRFHRTASEIRAAEHNAITIGYVGIIGPQDDVKRLIDCIWHLVHEFGQAGLCAIIVGDGDDLENVKRHAQHLGLTDRIHFTGILTGEKLIEKMCRFDLGVIPDRRNDFTDGAVMNKVFEYSALSIPTVAVALKETQSLLGDAGSYAVEDSAAGLAEACHRLISDPVERARKGRLSYSLVIEGYPTSIESAKYVAAYDGLIPSHRTRGRMIPHSWP